MVLEDRPRSDRAALHRAGDLFRSSGSVQALRKPPPLSSIDAYMAGPADPRGVVMDVSPRNLVCMSVFEDEVVVGSCDHALYAYDYRTGERRRTLYNKTNGHQAWVTCVQHLPDGRVLSAAMDSKLCLWGRKSTRAKDLLGHSQSIAAVKVSADGKLKETQPIIITFFLFVTVDSATINHQLILSGCFLPFLPRTFRYLSILR